MKDTGDQSERERVREYQPARKRERERVTESERERARERETLRKYHSQIYISLDIC